MGRQKSKDRKQKTFTSICASILFLLLVLNAQAFVVTRSISGVPLYWNSSLLDAVANPLNTSGLSSSQITSALDRSFAAWTMPENAAGYRLQVDRQFPARSANDNFNTIYFASASNKALGVGIVAVTEITYFVQNGAIAGMDMIFNDNNFQFTMNEGDTGDNTGILTKIYLPDVATHEIGHAFGFDHSTVHRSSLTYVAFNGQMQPGTDDLRGMRTQFGDNSSASRASVSGTIQGINGGIHGAQVNAINLHSGKVEAALLASPDGSFTLSNLPLGEYAFFVEPLLTSANTISTYYANVNHRFCGGAHFARTFYSTCGASGQASTIALAERNAHVELGTIAPSCEWMSNGPDAADGATFPVAQAGGAFFGPIATDETHFYKLENISGRIDVLAMSYTLFSPVDIDVTITNADGSAILDSTSIDNVSEPMPGGLTNYDARASAQNLPLGDYVVRVHSKPNYLWSFLYPAGIRLLNSNGFYFLSVAVNDSVPITGPSDMSACRSVANVPQPEFTFSTRQFNSEFSDQDSGAACGTISDLNGGGPPNPWNAPIVFVLLVALFLKLFVHLSPAVAATTRRR